MGTSADQKKRGQSDVSANCAVWQRMFWGAVQMAQQELDRLWEELQRLENDIKEQEKDLREATTERDSVIIQRGIDRLVQKEGAVRQQLSTMQVNIASSAGEVLATPQCQRSVRSDGTQKYLPCDACRVCTVTS